MTTTTVQAGFDTWADAAHASLSHGDGKSLHVATTAERAFIHTAIPAPPGSTVVSAVLSVYAKGTSSGSRTLTIRRVTEAWKARTLNWNNQPAVTDVGMVSVAVTTLADKTQIQFDVTALVQAIVSGTNPNYGWRISTSGSDHAFYSAQSGVKNPTLVVTYVEGPGQPTKLAPAGGLVSVSQPTLQWAYTGTDDLASYRVQADSAASSSSPAYDSGTISATVGPIHLLAGTAFAQLGSDGATTFWRVQVTDTAGQTSDWSDWVSMTRDNKGTLTITNPATSPDNYVTEPTPPILFTLTGETLTAFQVLITDAADHNLIVHDSGKLAATVGAYTIPVRPRSGRPYLLTGSSYTLRVRAYDTKQRQGSLAVGDEPYVEAVRDFTMTDGATTVPTVISVEQVDVTPSVTVTFISATAPDEFVVLRDDEEVAAGLLPQDVIVTDTTYEWRDWSAHPRVPHTYTVKAVVNGVQSSPSDPVSMPVGTMVTDLWVVDPATGRYFALWGTDISNWTHAEVANDYWPLSGRGGFRITESLGGLTGTFSGSMGPQPDRAFADLEADLWAMKEDAPHSDTYRLVLGNLNIPVRIFNVTCVPNEDESPDFHIRNVSFGFAQTGEFEFEGQV